MFSGLASIILAAGKGVRMRSDIPKVLHAVCGRTLLSRALEKTRALGSRPLVVVIGFGRDQVQAAFPDQGITWAVQEKQLGTGDAAEAGLKAIPGFEGDVLVLNGDLPHLQSSTLEAMVARHRSSRADATILTCVKPDPSGYGRIIRDGPGGKALRIIEEPDADDETRKITEINAGTYVYKARVLREVLVGLGQDNVQKERYLTDAFSLAIQSGHDVQTYALGDPQEIEQVSDRRDLVRATRVMRRQVMEELLGSGVTVIEPETTYIEDGVAIGRDTIIWPFTVIRGGAVIGKRCIIGPFVEIPEGAVLDDGATVGG